MGHSLGPFKPNVNSVHLGVETQREKGTCLLPPSVAPCQSMPFAADAPEPTAGGPTLRPGTWYSGMQYYSVLEESPRQTLRTLKQLKNHWNEVDLQVAALTTHQENPTASSLTVK